jgi:hypothetical protein
MSNKDDFIEGRPVVILVSIEALPLHVTMRVPLNAKDIFMDHEAHTLEEIRNHQGKETRWEKYWIIDILEE